MENFYINSSVENAEAILKSECNEKEDTEGNTLKLSLQSDTIKEIYGNNSLSCSIKLPSEKSIRQVLNEDKEQLEQLAEDIKDVKQTVNFVNFFNTDTIKSLNENNVNG